MYFWFILYLLLKEAPASMIKFFLSQALSWTKSIKALPSYIRSSLFFYYMEKLLINFSQRRLEVTCLPWTYLEITDPVTMAFMSLFWFLWHNRWSLSRRYIGTIFVNNLPRLRTTNFNKSYKRKWFHTKKKKKTQETYGITQKLLLIQTTQII